MVRLLARCVCAGMLVLAIGAGLDAVHLLRAEARGPFASIGGEAEAAAGAVRDARAPTPAAPPAGSATPDSLALAGTHPSFGSLQSQVDSLLQEAGGTGAVSLIELGGPDPRSWSLDGDQSFDAASTYKQPLLMMEAQRVAAGQAGPNDTLCYQDGDWEDGPFSDYADGSCYSRSELERRVGEYSDNTAAHILVRADGGGESLNAYAQAHGATRSSFYDPNTTTSDDLARLWASEATGQAGGPAAQRYLYPLLTGTAYEDGIPAGVPAGTTVVHKVGFIDADLHDSALVTAGPRGPYALAICTGGSASWSLLAAISRAVWSFEATR
jgi:beta-lactamase class A